MPRICLVNPNMTSSVTELLLGSGNRVANPDTRLIGLTASKGFPYISNHAEGVIASGIVLEMIAEQQAKEPANAFIIAAFGDPGVFAARQLFDVPIIGMSEAAMYTACMLGKRFAIVTFAQALAGWYKDCVEMHGLAAKLSGIHSSDTPFTDLSTVQHAAEESLIKLSQEAVESGADVIILGGAPLAGLAENVRDRIKVPTVDPISAAVKQAEGIVALRPRPPLAGSYRRPDPKAAIGLHASLADRIEYSATSD
jgi:Asp/Glu/hydantoin racemase